MSLFPHGNFRKVLCYQAGFTCPLQDWRVGELLVTLDWCLGTDPHLHGVHVYQVFPMVMLIEASMDKIIEVVKPRQVRKILHKFAPQTLSLSHAPHKHMSIHTLVHGQSTDLILLELYWILLLSYLFVGVGPNTWCLPQSSNIQTRASFDKEILTHAHLFTELRTLLTTLAHCPQRKIWCWFLSRGWLRVEMECRKGIGRMMGVLIISSIPHWCSWRGKFTRKGGCMFSGTASSEMLCVQRYINGYIDTQVLTNK